MVSEPSIPFNSYFDTQGQNDILNKLMDFKANRWQNAVGQGFQGLNAAIAGAQKRAQQQKQQQALAGIMSQLQNNPTGAQAGPQMPSSQLPAGQAGPAMPPPSGMGAPAQPFNGIDPKQLIQALGPDTVQKMIQQRMTPSPQMNPLQQSQMALNQAKTGVLNRPPQQKMTNPLDDAIKQKRLEMMALLMKKAQMQGQPKPPNPVPAAALDVRTQIANNAQAPWYKKLIGNVPPVVNPLKGQSVSASSASDMSYEDLMRLAAQDDNQ